MKNFKSIFQQTKGCVIALFIGLLILSCDNTELNDVVPAVEQETTDDVSIALARQVALKFAELEEFRRGSDPRISSSGGQSSTPSGFQEQDIDSVIIIPDDKGSPAIYVVTFSPAGYIIVSATMKENPILGFSTASRFQLKDMPLGLAEWLAGRMDKIQALKYTKGLEISFEVKDEWMAMVPARSAGREESEED